ncbi:MAG: hypothetical protein HQL58_13790 [Magnetococcales bacterium]|nr:hypothetical protein [Magnetococcales bacterium]
MNQSESSRSIALWTTIGLGWLVAASGSLYAEPLGQKLSGSELKGLLSGNTAEGINHLKQREFKIFYNVSGALSGSSQNTGQKAASMGLKPNQDIGKWWMEGDDRCVQWNSWDSSGCGSVFKKGDDYLYHPRESSGAISDEPRATFRVVTGNPHNL